MKKILFFLHAALIFTPFFIQSIEYQDIINTRHNRRLPYTNNSRFAREFNRFATRQEKIKHLLRLCTVQAHGDRTLLITNIPQKNALGERAALLKIRFISAQNPEVKNEFSEYGITLDQTGRQALQLELQDAHNVMRWSLNSPEGIISKLQNHDNISGATIMNIFDGLCSLCNVGTMMLSDVATMPEMEVFDQTIDFYPRPLAGFNNLLELKVLYPYLYGQTFYERYGFLPKGLDAREYHDYIQARGYLTHRPLTEILFDFTEKPDVFTALMQGFNELQLFPNHRKALEQATIRDALYVPYIRAKTLSERTRDPITGRFQRYYLEILNKVYENCLIDYTAHPRTTKTRYIKNLQDSINGFIEYEKIY